jgi:S1-C subfamily serine protease
LLSGVVGSSPADQDPDGERRPGSASFVLSAETIRPIYEDLARTGHVPHGFLGVRTRPASVTLRWRTIPPCESAERRQGD